MRKIRLLGLALLGFIVTAFGTFFAPGTWLNRAIAISLCTVLGADSTLCAAKLAESSQRAVAATPNAIERLIAQHSTEYDPCSSPSYTRLLSEEYPPEVLQNIERNNSSLQRRTQGAMNYDEYKTTVKLPSGLTASQIFQEMLTSMNSVGRGTYADEFTKLGQFPVTSSPTVGTILNLGLGSGAISQIEHGGDIVITEISTRNSSNQYFNVATLNSPNINNGSFQANRAGRHPVNGKREFGFETNADGSVSFYTRAADQWNNPIAKLGDNAMDSQAELWRNFMRGLAQRIKEEGGTVVRELDENKFSTPNFTQCSEKGPIITSFHCEGKQASEACTLGWRETLNLVIEYQDRGNRPINWQVGGYVIGEPTSEGTVESPNGASSINAQVTCVCDGGNCSSTRIYTMTATLSNGQASPATASLPLTCQPSAGQIIEDIIKDRVLPQIPIPRIPGLPF